MNEPEGETVATFRTRSKRLASIRVIGSNTTRQEQNHGRSIQASVASPTPFTNRLPRAKSPHTNVRKTYSQSQSQRQVQVQQQHQQQQVQQQQKVKPKQQHVQPKKQPVRKQQQIQPKQHQVQKQQQQHQVQKQQQQQQSNVHRQYQQQPRQEISNKYTARLQAMGTTDRMLSAEHFTIVSAASHPDTDDDSLSNLTDSPTQKRQPPPKEKQPSNETYREYRASSTQRQTQQQPQQQEKQVPKEKPKQSQKQQRDPSNGRSRRQSRSNKQDKDRSDRHHSQRRSRDEMGNFGTRDDDTPDTTPSTASSRSSRSESPDQHRSKSHNRRGREPTRKRQEDDSLATDSTVPRLKPRASSAQRAGAEKRNKGLEDWKRKGRYVDENSLLKEGLRECLRTSKSVGLRMKECMVISADVYQQECITQHSHRGDDALFLAHKEKFSSPPKDSQVGTSNLPRHATHILDENDIDELLNPPPQVNNTRRHGDVTSKPPGWIDSEDLEIPKLSASRDDGENSILHQENEKVTPLQHHSVPKPSRPKTAAEFAHEFSELRSLRLSMFQQSSTHVDDTTQDLNENLYNLDSPGAPDDPIPTTIRSSSLTRHRRRDSEEQPQGNIVSLSPEQREPRSRALLESATGFEVQANEHFRQVEDMDILQQELKQTRKALKEAVDTLHCSHNDSFLKQSASADQESDKLFRERLEVEEKLRSEMKSNEMLSFQVRDLEDETKALRLALLEAKETARACSRSFPDTSMDEETDGSEPNDKTIVMVMPRSSNKPGDTADQVYESRRQVLRQKEQRLSRLVESLRRQDSEDETSVDRSKGEPVQATSPDKQNNSSPQHAAKTNNDEEIMKRKRLEAQIITLKAEVSTLREMLEKSNTAKNALEENNKEMQEETRTLKSELAELRTTVEALKEDKEDDNVVFQTEVDLLKNKLDKTEEDMRIRTKEKEKVEKDIFHRKKEAERLRDEVLRLNEQIETIQDKLEATEKQVDVLKTEKEQTKEEMNTCKNESERLRGEVARFMNELEREKMTNKTKLRVTEEEAKTLQDEVRQMKAKLSESNADILNQAAEHLEKRRQLEYDLKRTQETAQSLQKKVIMLDDQVANTEAEANALRAKIERDEASKNSSMFSRNNFGLFSDPNIGISMSSARGQKGISSESSEKGSSVIDRLRKSMDGIS